MKSPGTQESYDTLRGLESQQNVEKVQPTKRDTRTEIVSENLRLNNSLLATHGIVLGHCYDSQATFARLYYLLRLWLLDKIKLKFPKS